MTRRDPNEQLRKTAEELFAFATELGLVMREIVFTPYGQLSLRNFPRRTYYYKLRKFERQGLIKKTDNHRSAAYVLTDKAKRLRKDPSVKIRRHDGQASIVLFDIPEAKRQARDNLRRYLLRNGYTQIQKSVFLSPFQIFDELKEFIRELGIETHVTFISGHLDR